jgi:hypothetical protein
MSNNKFGIGADPGSMVSIGEQCDADWNTDSSKVSSSSKMCMGGLVCKNGICIDEFTGKGGPPKAPEVVKVYSRQAGQSCEFDRMGDIDKITSGSNVCANGLYCNNGTCSESPQLSSAQSGEEITGNVVDNETGQVIEGSCSDPETIMFVQQTIGVEPDGNWGCYSQNKLTQKGFKNLREVVQCEGPDPDPCAYGQCINGQCPSNQILDQQKEAKSSDFVNVNDQEVIQKEEEKKSLPWGWIVAGVAIAALGGTGVYLYSKSKSSKTTGVKRVRESNVNRITITDQDRRDFIFSDDTLYEWYVVSGLSMRQFIKSNKSTLDEIIYNVKSGKKQPHYLRHDKSIFLRKLNESKK